MLTQLINARILTPQGWLKDGSVLIRDGKILEVTNCDLAVIGAQLIDVKGMYVLPGGVEIHAHGGGGRDFMECTEDAFRGAVKTHMKYGTTSIFPTLSSSTVPMIEQAAETCTKMMAEKDSPILGLHLEGHYLNMAMAGFVLKNTVSENGAVTRGICTVDDNDMLTDVLETSGIAIEAEGTVVCDREEVKSWITPDVHVSMNMWAAYPEFLDKLESGFAEFLKDESGDPLKKEYLIPIIVDGLLKQNKATVKVLETQDKWIGITYKEDTELAQAGFREMIRSGKYPAKLWD